MKWRMCAGSRARFTPRRDRLNSAETGCRRVDAQGPNIEREHHRARNSAVAARPIPWSRLGDDEPARAQTMIANQYVNGGDAYRFYRRCVGGVGAGPLNMRRPSPYAPTGRRMKASCCPAITPRGHSSGHRPGGSQRTIRSVYWEKRELPFLHFHVAHPRSRVRDIEVEITPHGAPPTSPRSHR